jgi:hypothetical protein
MEELEAQGLKPLIRDEEKDMRNWILSIFILFVFAAAQPALAGESHHADSHTDGGHAAMSGHGAAEGMKHDSSMADMHTFEHQAVVDGIKAEFQVMRLADMHMTDPEGRTHHIMVKLAREGSGQSVVDTIGKIKVIAPDKQEQTGVLKRYGDFLAANFTFDAPGNYGVICLLVVDGQKHVVKFWYPYHK